jgi:hypothetical protein
VSRAYQRTCTVPQYPEHGVHCSRPCPVGQPFRRVGGAAQLPLPAALLPTGGAVVATPFARPRNQANPTKPRV